MDSSKAFNFSFKNLMRSWGGWLKVSSLACSICLQSFWAQDWRLGEPSVKENEVVGVLRGSGLGGVLDAMVMVDVWGRLVATVGPSSWLTGSQF